jgi:MFS family permease
METSNILPVASQEHIDMEKSIPGNLTPEEISANDSTEKPQSLEEQEAVYPEKFKLVLIVLALNLSMFLIGLDNTILSTAIPKITDQFHALDDVGWYASSYLLTTCAFQLMWGKLYTFYSTKWIYLTGLFIFELGSLICGVAPTSTALIVGRAIAGVGSGAVGSGSFVLVAHSVPPRQRPTLVGMIGGMYGFAAIAGPLMGGAFTDNPNLTCRLCFYINLPLGFLTALVILFFVPSSTSKKVNMTSFADRLKQMDLLGLALLLPGVICLLLAMQWGGTKYDWKSGRVIALLILAIFLLVGFVVVQVWSGENATVPVRVFGNRNIWGSAIFGACVTASFFVILYYVSSTISL